MDKVFLLNIILWQYSKLNIMVLFGIKLHAKPYSYMGIYFLFFLSNLSQKYFGPVLPFLGSRTFLMKKVVKKKNSKETTSQLWATICIYLSIHLNFVHLLGIAQILRHCYFLRL